MPYRLGTILQKNKFISETDLQKALQIHKETGYKLGECLRILNICSEEELNFAIYKQIEMKNRSSKKGYTIAVLFPFLKRIFQFKSTLIGLIFAALIGAVFSTTLIIPVLIGFVVDHVLPTQNYQLLLIVSAIGGSAILIAHCIELLIAFLANNLNAKVINSLLSNVFTHINSLTYPLFAKFEKGDIISRFTDNAEILSIRFTRVIAAIFQNTFIFLILIILLLKLNVLLTVCSLAVLLLLIIIPSFISLKASIYVSKAPQLISKIATFLNEITASFFYIKANNKETLFQRLLSVVVGEYYLNNFKMWIMLTFSFNIKQALNGLLSLVILWYGGHLVFSDQLSLGSLLSFYFLLVQFIPRMDRFFSSYIDIQFIKTEWRRLQELLNLPDSDHLKKGQSAYLSKDRIPDYGAKIEIKNVHFRYSLNGADIIHDLTVTFQRGEMYAVVGESGSGKSTFLKMLMGLYKPVSGSILYNNKSLEHINFHELWASIGYLSQQPFVYDDETIYTNIIRGINAIQNEIAQESVFEAAKKAGIYEFIMSLPDGFETVIGQKGVSLSGGEKQRIALSRIFIRQPSILILDEPTSALDEENAAHLLQAIFREQKNTILFLSTHTLANLRDFRNLLNFTNDKIIVIDHDKQEVSQMLSELSGEQRLRS